MPNPKVLLLDPLRRTANDARQFAYAAHKGHNDKAGAPYWRHLARVHRRLVDLRPPHWDEGALDQARQIAYLHDVVEDTEYGAEDLTREGFSRPIVFGVMALTKQKHLKQSYADWIASLATCAPLPTLLVKIADVEDNSDPARLALLPAETRARLEKKYGAALPVLKAAAERLGWAEPNGGR